MKDRTLSARAPFAFRICAKGVVVLWLATFRAVGAGEPPAGTKIVHPIDGAIMVYVPGGEFTMGLDEAEADHIARDLGYKKADDLWAWEAYPKHKVNVPGFFIDQCEVTVARWQKYIKATGAVLKSTETSRHFDKPVEQSLPAAEIPWDDAKKYADWAGKALPTEAQWEKAARGTDGRLYPWGNEPPTAARGHFGAKDKTPALYTAVGSYPQGASPYGALDMLGNQYEWTADRLVPYPDNPRADKMKAHADGSLVCARGGSWYHGWIGFYAAKRFGLEPNETYYHIGFRTAWVPPAGYFESDAFRRARVPPFKVLPATAYHILPETTTEESGYFSLCEGRNGKIYVGTAAYGRDSYLVEFDPATEQMRVALDTHKLVGLPLTPTGYAAQSKIHTRNFVGPSGKIYLGSKQGYPSAKEKETGQIPAYRGGYVMTFDPATDTAASLGMPMPLGDPLLPADAKEGEGVIDVAADEARGLLYVITAEHQRWMLFDTRHPEQGYRDLGPILRNQPNTLIDGQGRATAITEDYRVARYDPAADKVSVVELLGEGRPFHELIGPNAVHPDWRLAADGRTAYLQLLNDARLFVLDLSGAAGQPVIARSLGTRIAGKNPDSRGSLSIGPDGRVYSVVRIDNDTGFGSGYLHHLIRYDPRRQQMEDLGVLTVKNPEFFDFKAPAVLNPDGTGRPTHGFHSLPDGTLTPLHHHMACTVAHDGTIYVTITYPFTLLRVPAI
jgi:formylglycine-generating enzyme required for sulfatase activity